MIDNANLRKAETYVELTTNCHVICVQHVGSLSNCTELIQSITEWTFNLDSHLEQAVIER